MGVMKTIIAFLFCAVLVAAPALPYRMTYADVVSFLARDQTDKLAWGDGFGCIQFSQMLTYHARVQGFTAESVEVYLSLDDLGNVEGHNFVQFLTVDRGWVWFEPQTDQEYYVRQPGQKFCSIVGDCWLGSILSVKVIP